MSLVHESLIALLNRTFVCTHYNVAPNAPGWDKNAVQYVTSTRRLNEGMHESYGTILTTDREMLVSFGYDRDSLIGALRRVLKKRPELTRLSKAQQDVLQRAAREPNRWELQLAAARLQSERLRFKRADEILVSVLDRCKDAEWLRRAHFLRGHLAAIRLPRPDRDLAQQEFAAMGKAPDDLADDIFADLVSLDVRLRRRGSYFTGYEFRRRVDLVRRQQELQRWIAKAPASNRIGELHFYLGLALMGQGKPEAANRVWRQHVAKWPEDRFAMLSRLHDTNYRFSPYSKTNPYSSLYVRPKAKRVGKDRR